MKKFFTSQKQSNFVMVALFVALVSTFFPAMYVATYGVSLFSGQYWFLITIAILLAILTIFFNSEILDFLRKKYKNFESEHLDHFVVLMTSLSLLGVILFGIDLFRASSKSNGFFGLVSSGFGFYFVLISLIFALACVFFFPQVDKIFAKISENFDKNENSSEKLLEKSKEKVEEIKEKISEKSEELKEKAENKIEEVKEKIEETKENIVEKAEEIKEKVEEKIAEFGEKSEKVEEEIKEETKNLEEKVEEKTENSTK